MGREIRKVPAGWQHPRWTEEDAIRPTLIGKLRPIHDESYSHAAEEWLKKLADWEAGSDPDRAKYSEYRYYWDWNCGPPDKDSYRDRDWTEAEATHFVVYETVTEGTPVTPIFATPEELIEHLATKGTDWDNGQGWDRHSAEEFVKDGWAPSMVMRPGQGCKSVNESGFYDD